MRNTNLLLPPAANDCQQLEIYRGNVPMPQTTLPTTLDMPRVRPGLLAHWVESVKERLHDRIEITNIEHRSHMLRAMTEQVKLESEYQGALQSMAMAALEHRTRIAELRHKRIEFVLQRKQAVRLAALRLQKEQVALRLEIAKSRQARRETTAPKQDLSAEQQRLIKKAQLQERLEQLRAEQAAVVRRERGQDNKRRIENVYANRIEQLLEELGGCL